MRKIFFIIALIFFAHPTHSALSSKEQLIHVQLAKKVLEHTNQYRASKGLPPLRWNQPIANICVNHSMNMAKGQIQFGHDGFKKRISLLSPKPDSSAENIYMANMGENVVNACINAWIRSPGHEKNLVGNYTDCGIGLYKNAKGFWYFTQIFSSFALTSSHP